MDMRHRSDRFWPSLLDASREMMRDFRHELLPRVPQPAVLWGIALGAMFVIPGAFDLLSATSRSAKFWSPAWFGAAAFAICFCAGFQAAWQKRDFGYGGVVALVAILIGFVVALGGDVAAVLVIATFRTFDVGNALYWALEVPLPVMLLVGGSIGALGAAIAAGLRRTPIMQS